MRKQKTKEKSEWQCYVRWEFGIDTPSTYKLGIVNLQGKVGGEGVGSM